MDDDFWMLYSKLTKPDKMKIIGQLSQVVGATVRAVCRMMKDGVDPSVPKYIIENGIKILSNFEDVFEFCSNDKRLLEWYSENWRDIRFFGSCRYEETRLYPSKRSCWGCNIVREVRVKYEKTKEHTERGT